MTYVCDLNSELSLRLMLTQTIEGHGKWSVSKVEWERQEMKEQL